MEDVPIKPSWCFSCYAAVLLLAAVGCTPTPGEPTPKMTTVAAPVEAPAGEEPTAEAPVVEEPAGEEPAQSRADREVWDVYMIQGSRVGYGRIDIFRDFYETLLLCRTACSGGHAHGRSTSVVGHNAPKRLFCSSDWS